MTDHGEPDDLLLSGEELRVVKLAAHRQLSRWATSRQPLNARKQARRDALLAALRVLDDHRLDGGCNLRPTAASA
ncbi:MAG: hypothetical protein ACRDLN_13410 [Solirubrobacteraceae bacterium]